MKRRREREPWDWLLQDASASDLRVVSRELTGRTYPKSWTRRKVLHGTIGSTTTLRNHPRFESLVQDLQEVQLAKRKATGARLREEGRAKIDEQRDNKLVWRTLEAELARQPIVTLKITPVGFYSERACGSGPGTMVVKHFQDAKAKYVQAKVGWLVPIIPNRKPLYVSGFWRDLQFTASMEREVRYEYVQPDLQFGKDRLSVGTLLTMRFDAPPEYDNAPMWKPRGYWFRHELAGAAVTWHAKWWLISLQLAKLIQVTQLVQMIGAFYLEERLG